MGDRIGCRLRRARSASRSKSSRAAVGGSRRSVDSTDESATGSANFFGPRDQAAARAAGRIGSRPVSLRPPSIDHGIKSFVWAFVIGLMLWLFMLGIGISKATSFIVAALVACGIFLYVRLYGEDEPRRRSPR